MNKKRILGILISIIGLTMSLSDIKMTGAVIGLPAEPVIKIAGIIILLIGFAIIAIVTEQKKKPLKLEEQIESYPQSTAQYNQLKEKYRFWESHGAPPESPKAWITRYHAYPRGSKTTFAESLDSEKATGGFFFAKTKSDAIDAAEAAGYLREDLKVAKIKIAKSIYKEKGVTSRDIIQYRTPSSEYRAEAPDYEYIPRKKYHQANKLIKKGLIVIEP